MKVSASVKGSEVVEQIIDHLMLSFVAEKTPRAPMAYLGLLIAAEASSGYFSWFYLAGREMSRQSSARLASATASFNYGGAFYAILTPSFIREYSSWQWIRKKLSRRRSLVALAQKA
jgi:hypothetical protein